MPHVVIKGPVDHKAAFEGMRPLMVKLPKGLLRTEGTYIDRDTRAILGDGLAIDCTRSVAGFDDIHA